MKIAILDDHQNVALEMADWSALSKRADITVFNDHVSDSSALVARLLPFDVVLCSARAHSTAERGASKPSAAGSRGVIAEDTLPRRASC
jgi:hypothetical protein